MDPSDPAVPHARRDLRIINILMQNHRWMLHQIHPLLRAGDHLIEWGGGDGSLARKFDAHRAVLPEFSFTVVDRAPRPTGLPPSIAWRSQDLLEPGDPSTGGDIVIANLILHHFEPDALGRLGARLKAGCRAFLACEPARRRLHQWQVRLLPLLGVHAVTRHDAHVSVGAGFRGSELNRWLNLEAADWEISVQETFFGAHRLLALRK